MPPWRLIHDEPAAGPWNMAVDEAMLESAAATGQGTLRFYRWRTPTLSLGYFQPLEVRRQHAASAACPVVRRSTGGGAIIHDREITYSIALPLEDRWSQQAVELYELMHNSLVGALSRIGIEATTCPASIHSLSEEPFLCFQRRAKGDVLVGPEKIAGSAQRRRRRAMVQHGSVLLARSAAAPELPGLSEIVGRTITAKELAGLWLETLAAEYQVGLNPSHWTDFERKRASEVADDRFSSPDWLLRRSEA